MITIKKTIWIVGIMALAITACNDDDSSNEPNAMSTEEAAEIVATSMAESTEGLTSQVEKASEDATQLVEQTNEGGKTAGSTSCGMDSTATFTRTNPSGSAVEYDYAFTYNYMMACNNVNLPEAITIGFEQEGMIDAPRFSTVDARSGIFSITNLDLGETEYQFNGTYDREGTHTSKINQQNSYTVDMDVDLTSLTINKGTYEITGGTASVTIAGTATNGASYNFTGSLDFLGGSEVQVTINGESFIINIKTGEIIN